MNIKSRFQIRLYKQTTYNRIGRLLVKFNTESVHIPNKRNIHLLWPVKDNFGHVLYPVWIWWTDRQTGHTTEIRYREHVQQSCSSYTNLPMAEHSTNAKFYIQFKVPMMLTVNNKLHGSPVKQATAIVSTDETGFKQLVSCNQPTNLLHEAQFLRS